MKKNLLLVLVLSSTIAQAQLSQVLPSRPIVSENIKITYDATSPKAVLRATEKIYARITCFLQDGGIEKFHQLLTHTQGVLSANAQLPKTTASLKIEFYHLNKDDDEASQSLMIYKNDRHTPVESAYVEGFFSNKADQLFALECANYPENYLAFAKYINVASMVKAPEVAKEVINTLLQKLNLVSQKENRNPWLLTALCVGNAKGGDLTTAKKYLFDLFQRYPALPATAFAFSIYNYEYYKSTSKQIEDDVRARVKYVFVKFPEAAICRDVNVFEYLKSDLTIETRAFEAVVAKPYAEQKIPYYALGNLPELLIARNSKLDFAKQLLIDAITSFQDGTIQHQYRLNNGHYQTYVPMLYHSLAQLNLVEGQEQQAITNASAAIQMLKGSNVEGNFLPLMLKLRANAFTRLGNYNLALADYQQMYGSGDTGVLDSLKKLFPLSNVKDKTFEGYFNSVVMANQHKKTTGELLPNFKGLDLSGKEISLTQLRGKIVVLNVWGTGCVPCIAEMPQLNELVKAFKNRSDVVFIAVTGDQKEDLIKFFKTRSFDYKVVANVRQITKTFNTNALPVHMVIGREGEIINRSIGAREDIQTYLSKIIEANL